MITELLSDLFLLGEDHIWAKLKKIETGIATRFLAVHTIVETWHNAKPVVLFS